MKTKTVTIRCEDNAEACVFTRYEFNNEIDYEISIEDSYIGKPRYQGFIGRLRRAWEAFCDKPVVYASIYSEGPEKVKKFLTDCLALVEGA
jgi:hypothetical protein